MMSVQDDISQAQSRFVTCVLAHEGNYDYPSGVSDSLRAINCVTSTILHLECYLIKRKSNVMLLPSILLFAATEFFLSLSPGPAVLLVVSQAVRSGIRASLLGTIGILTGNAIYFAISALGLGVILITSEALFLLIKWTGAVYLIYLGLKMIRDTLVSTPAKAQMVIPVSRRRLFRQGLLTQLANPKAILFFTALLPQFVDANQAAAYQFFLLGVISVMVELPILVSYGWLGDKAGHWFRQSRYSIWLDRVAGTFLIGAGVKLAFTKRT